MCGAGDVYDGWDLLNGEDGMKIYIASSWKNVGRAIDLAGYLRELGHEVDCFADISTGRYVFHFSEIGNRDQLDAMNFLDDARSLKAFQEDKKWLDWCKCCVLLLPAGKSSHLEAGYIKGQKKKLIIFQPGGFPKGEFDVMYGFADLMTYKFSELEKFLEKFLDCSDCDFVEIWPSYDEQRCKHHSLPEEDREIKTKEIPHWCPLKNDQAQHK